MSSPRPGCGPIRARSTSVDRRLRLRARSPRGWTRCAASPNGARRRRCCGSTTWPSRSGRSRRRTASTCSSCSTRVTARWSRPAWRWSAVECETALRLDNALVEHWLGHRNDVAALEALIGKGFVVDTMEIAAPWSVMPAHLRVDDWRPCPPSPGTLAVSAHQSHSYQTGGCLYFTFAGQGRARRARPLLHRDVGRRHPCRARRRWRAQPSPRRGPEPGPVHARGARPRVRDARRREGRARSQGDPQPRQARPPVAVRRGAWPDHRSKRRPRAYASELEPAGPPCSLTSTRVVARRRDLPRARRAGRRRLVAPGRRTSTSHRGLLSVLSLILLVSFALGGFCSRTGVAGSAGQACGGRRGGRLRHHPAARRSRPARAEATRCRRGASCSAGCSPCVSPSSAVCSPVARGATITVSDRDDPRDRRRHERGPGRHRPARRHRHRRALRRGPADLSRAGLRRVRRRRHGSRRPRRRERRPRVGWSGRRRWASPTSGRRPSSGTASTGEPVGPGIGWQDLRTVGTCLVLQGDGIRLAPNLSATKLAYLLDTYDPDRSRDLCFGTVDSWIAWTLSAGAAHVTDATNAALTGLRTADQTAWHDGILDALRIPRSCLPRDRRLDRRLRRGLVPSRRATDRRDRGGSTGVAGRPGMPPSRSGQGHVRDRRDARRVSRFDDRRSRRVDRAGRFRSSRGSATARRPGASRP